MKLFKLLLIGVVICFVFAGQSPAGEVTKFKSDGIQAEVDWADDYDRIHGRFSMQKTSAHDGMIFFHFRIVIKDGFSWRTFQEGSGYFPENAIKGTVDGQLNVAFDSSQVPTEHFWGRSGTLPPSVDITFNKNWVTYSRNIGSTTAQHGDRTYRSHGIKISSSADVEGVVAGFPVMGAVLASVGENQGMSITIEKAEDN